jgi:ATP-dependent helicase/nuclease subunit A
MTGGIALSVEQQRAVTRVGQDVCVVAGPGSGKTRVLIERFGWLVEEAAVPPGRILAVTYTEKAAIEIKQRLVTRFTHRDDLREEIERAWVSTLHGFCARLLRENAIAAGIDPEFTVAEEARATGMQRAAGEEVLDAMLERDRETLCRFLTSIGVSSNPAARDQDLVSALLDVYEACRVAGASWNATPPTPLLASALAEVGKFAGTLVSAPRPGGLTAQQSVAHEEAAQWAARWMAVSRGAATPQHIRLLHDADRINLTSLKQGSAPRNALSRIKKDLAKPARGELLGALYADLRPLVPQALDGLDAIYRSRKRSAGLLDFSDLEERAIDLLRANDRIRDAVTSGFDHILMDELQDTNPPQWRLLDLIRTPGRFFGVGDINQSIYGFRHADPGAFEGYRDSVVSHGGAIDELRDNHRSRREILDAVNALVGLGLAGIEPHTLVARHGYPVKSEPSIEVLAALAERTDDGMPIEASMIARRIREFEGTLMVGDAGAEHPARFADMVILARSLNGLGPLTRALDAFQVPYLVVGGRTFFELAEIRDLTNLLKVLDNPRDELALARVLRSPLVGMSDETLLRLKSSAGVLAASLAGAAADQDIRDGDERDRLAAFHALLGELRAVRDAVSPDRLLARALDASGYESALEPASTANVEKFLALLRERYRGGARITGDLALELDVLRSNESEAEAPPDDSSNAVRILTVHKAKGLEFPVVFLAHAHRDVRGTTPNIAFSRDHGIGVRWREPGGAESTGDAAHQRIHADRTRREAREENRLLYVALSRAREHLVVSFVQHKRPAYWSGEVAKALGIVVGEAGPPVTLPKSDAAGIPSRRLWVAAEAAINDMPPPAEVAAPVEELVALPALEGQYDATASVTSVSLFAACPRRYYLSRYINWPGRDDDSGAGAGEPEPQPAPPPADSGGQFRFAFDGPDQGGTAKRLSGAELGTAAHDLLAGRDPGDAPDPIAVALAARFRASALGRRLAGAGRARHEQEFLFCLDEVVLRGQIDLWFEESGELILVDYKTDRSEDGADAYALQLGLYALAMERGEAGRLPDRAVLFYLRSGREVEVAVGDAARRAAEQLASLREAQQRQDFPIREGQGCRNCEYRAQACPVA